MLVDADNIARTRIALAAETLRGEGLASEWVEAECRLPPEVASVEGRFRLAPYQRGFLDIACMDGGPVKIVWLKAARVGYTSMLLASICYLLARARRHVLVYMPSDDDAKAFGKDSVSPFLRDCRATSALLGEVEDKRSQDANTYKLVGGKTLRIRGSASGRAFRRVTADVTMLDEIDGYPLSVGAAGSGPGGAGKAGEGDPVSLAFRAVKNSPFKRQLLGSTPTDEATSAVLMEHMGCELRLAFHVPCPLCGEFSTLDWENFHWPKDGTPSSRSHGVRHMCPACGESWRYDRLPGALAGGEWRAPEYETAVLGGTRDENPLAGWRVVESPGEPPRLLDAEGVRRPWPDSVGFHLWAAYSPYYSWREWVREWLSAVDEPEKMRSFTNHVRGVCWRDSASAVVTETELHQMKACLTPLPNEVVYVSVGVDVQDGWLSALAVGWDVEKRAYVLEQRVFAGVVSREDGAGWEALGAWLASGPSWRRADGADLGIGVVGVDSGYQTLACYRAVPRLPHPLPLLLKGDANFAAPEIKLPPGRARAGDGGSAPLFSLGVSQAKRTLVQRMRDGGVVLADTLEDQTLLELASERMARRIVNGRAKWRWEQIRPRNEALDCLTYSYCSMRLARPSLDAVPAARPVARPEPREPDEVAAPRTFSFI